MIHMTLFERYLQPKSTNDDTRRQEFILNLLLLGSLVLAAVAFFIVLANYILYYRIPLMQSRVYLIGCIFLFFFGLYLLSRLQLYRIAAVIFLFTYFVIATYTLYTWGILMHIGLLLYALIIVIAGVLLGSRLTFFITCLITVTLFILAYSTANHTIEPSLSWTQSPGGFDDAITFSTIFLIITVVSWLSNRETERSLARARRSEQALREQRDQLEILAEKRAQELTQVRQEEFSYMYQFAEIGKMASALIHDLINPLTSISLSLEKLESKEKSIIIKRAMNGVRLMDGFIQMARREIKQQKIVGPFSLEKSIRSTINALEAKAKGHRITILFQPKVKLETVGSSAKFQEMISNLINNAIDAYIGYPAKLKQQPTVTVTLDSRYKGKRQFAVISIHDNGRGISKEIMAKMYEPFFTTKEQEHGLGLGLSIVRDLATKEFHGGISATSQPAKGTTFTVQIPIKAPQT